MSEITNYNCHNQCQDICNERYCDNLTTYYWTIKIGDFDFLIPMCLNHYNKTWQSKLIGVEQ